MADAATPALMNKAFWSQDGGAAWARVQALMNRLNQPIAEAVIDRADPGPGGRVLDIGCGGGATTLAMARRVGPDGGCVGADVSERLVAMAQQEALEEALPAQFVVADAQTYPFETGGFDAVMSRFGVMFFDDPVMAFANLRRALRPQGRLTFACWRAPADNPLAQVPMQAAAPLLSKPPPAPPAEGPGRFSFADPDKVRAILAASGWREVEIEPLDAPSPLTLDELMSISIELGALGGLIGQETPAAQSAIREAVRSRLQAYVRADGIVPMTSACWLVGARP